MLAVNDVSLSLRPGEVLGLIGPNGSGKTTLLNLISGLLRASSGQLFVDGREVTAWPAHQIARLGVARTFQTVRLYSRLSVSENVAVGTSARGSRAAGPRSEAGFAALLDRFGLGRYSAREASTLSYGDQRRLEIARALAGAPNYLLLDEPAAGMNEAESDDLLAILRAISYERRIGLLVVDHDLRLIMRLCDRIHVLNGGRTIAVGTPTEVRADSEVRAAYLGDRRG